MTHSIGSYTDLVSVQLIKPVEPGDSTGMSGLLWGKSDHPTESKQPPLTCIYTNLFDDPLL